MNQYVQTVRLRGEPVAIVGGGEARIAESVSAEDEGTVQAMCLFAMEVQAGAVNAPYTDRRALTYAQLADRQRTRAGR